MAKMKRKYKQQYQSLKNKLDIDIKTLDETNSRLVQKIVKNHKLSNKQLKEVHSLILKAESFNLNKLLEKYETLKPTQWKYEKLKTKTKISNKDKHIDIKNRGFLAALYSVIGKEEVQEIFKKLILNGYYNNYEQILDKLYELMGEDVYSHLYNVESGLEQYKLSLPSPEAYDKMNKLQRDKEFRLFIHNNADDYLTRDSLMTDLNLLFVK